MYVFLPHAGDQIKAIDIENVTLQGIVDLNKKNSKILKSTHKHAHTNFSMPPYHKIVDHFATFAAIPKPAIERASKCNGL